MIPQLVNENGFTSNKVENEPQKPTMRNRILKQQLAP